MSGSIRLYHFLHQALQSLGHLGRKENRVTLAMLMVGIFKGHDVRLGRIAQHVPLDITQDSVEQRFRRWLKNPHVEVRAFYDPVARGILWALRHTRLRIQIDRTIVDGRFNVLMISLYRRKRAIPLIWRVLPHSGCSDYLDWVDILSHLADLLPPNAQVLLLGDREFGTADMMDLARWYGWDYCLRVKSDQRVLLQHQGPWQSLSALSPDKGAQYFLTDVTFTKTHHYRTHLALAWEKDSDEPWFIATNRLPSRRTLLDYARRFGCEELFSDLKARGFDLEKSQLEHAQRFERRLLAIALLTVWVLSVGRRLLVTGCVLELFCPSHIERFSLFQMGYRWLAKQLSLGYSLIPDGEYRFWQVA